MHPNKLFYVLPPTVTKFLLVGIINTAVFYLSFVFFIYLGWNYLVASTVGYSVAVIISYLLNKLWAFKSMKESTIALFIQFVALNFFSLGTNLIVLYISVDYFQLNLYFSQLISIFFSMAINFIGYKKLFNV